LVFFEDCQEAKRELKIRQTGLDRISYLQCIRDLNVGILTDMLHGDCEWCTLKLLSVFTDLDQSSTEESCVNDEKVSKKYIPT
jgi:hypothetical protein